MAGERLPFSSVALNIEPAEVALEPFVDALLLAKCGVNPIQTPAAHETSGDPATSPP